MSVLVDGSRVQIKLGRYGMAPATALVDPRVHQQAQDFRRQLGMRMQALDKKDVRKLPESEYHASRKVDGEFNVLVVDGGQAILVNPGGTVRVGLAALDEAAARVAKAGAKRALFACELYVARPDGKRGRVHDVTQISRQPASEKELATLRLAVFDLIELDGKPAGPAFAESWREIGRVFGGGERVHPVEAVIAKDVAEVERRFEKWVEEEGAEGVVARSDAAGQWKIKPRHSIDAVVIGFTEGTEDRQGMLHDLLLALMRRDGSYHVLGRVGGGFTDDDRRNFLSDLKDRVVESEYAEVNDHVAYQMVRPEWVVEISILDLIAQTTRGAAINRMVLHCNGKWEPLRRLPLCGLISPQFVRRRDDKRVHPADLRLEQVSDLVEVDLAERDATQMTLRRSEILRREVYTKQLKGQTMVRKFVLWKTHKETESENHPAYVAHFTDFSPNRKTPLEREIRVSNSHDQIDGLYDALVKENVKQGWSPAASGIVAAAAPTPLRKLAEPGPAAAAPAAPTPPAVVPAAKSPAEKKPPRGKRKAEED